MADCSVGKCKAPAGADGMCDYHATMRATKPISAQRGRKVDKRWAGVAFGELNAELHDDVVDDYDGLGQVPNYRESGGLHFGTNHDLKRELRQRNKRKPA